MNYKEAERKVARWIKGVRNPSMGFAFPDVESEAYTFEMKARDKKAFPLWIENAFDQARVNKGLRPEKENFVLFSLHKGKGFGIRYFLAKEVYPESEDARVIDLLSATGKFLSASEPESESA